MNKSSEPYIEMAIQTILYQYQNQLENGSYLGNKDLYKEMASGIHDKAIEYERITDLTLKKLEKL